MTTTYIEKRFTGEDVAYAPTVHLVYIANRTGAPKKGTVFERAALTQTEMSDYLQFVKKYNKRLSAMNDWNVATVLLRGFITLGVTLGTATSIVLWYDSEAEQVKPEKIFGSVSASDRYIFALRFSWAWPTLTRAVMNSNFVSNYNQGAWSGTPDTHREEFLLVNSFLSLR